MIIVAAVAYTLQLYMEFSGCMDIVIGSGNLFGVDLPENFRQPFFSGNASEFWRRWHITPGAWLKSLCLLSCFGFRSGKRSGIILQENISGNI